MSQCLVDGDFRAYLDRELEPEDLARVAQHLGTCAACHAQYNEVAARAARVTALMGALDAPLPVVFRPKAPVRQWVRPAVGLALAAGLASLFLGLPKRSVTPGAMDASPVASQAISPLPAQSSSQALPPQALSPQDLRQLNAVQSLAPHPAPATSVMNVSRPTVARPRRLRAVQSANSLDYYLALDNEPIETGTIMRVALGNQTQADVIFDDYGRARAIRPVPMTSISATSVSAIKETK